jgi:hypothetical protein
MVPCEESSLSFLRLAHLVRVFSIRIDYWIRSCRLSTSDVTGEEAGAVKSVLTSAVNKLDLLVRQEPTSKVTVPHPLVTEGGWQVGL